MSTDNTTQMPSLHDQRYYALVNGLGDIVSRYQPDGTLLFVSENYCAFFEHTEEELLGRKIYEFLDDHVYESTKQRLASISVTSPVIEGLNVIHQKHGGARHVSWVTTGIFGDDGTLMEFQSIGRDVTHIMATEEQLSMSEMRYRQAVDIAGLGYWVWDEREDRLDFCSDTAAAIYGISKDRGRLRVVHADDKERYDRIVSRAAETLISYDITYRIVHGNGETCYLRELAEPLIGENGKLHQTIGTIQDVTEREVAAQKINHMARYDALTDLPNRSLFLDRLETGIRNAERDRKPLALLFIDLDGFKPINDDYGHQAGDGVLVEVATRFTSCVRASDTVGRYGGDEFVALLGGDIDAVRSILVAEKILEEISRPIDTDGLSLNVGASIGIAVYPKDGKSSAELMSAADAAMYDVKRSGKGGYRQVSQIRG